MDFEVDMLKFWVEQLQELLPDPTEDDEEAEGESRPQPPSRYR